MNKLIFSFIALSTTISCFASDGSVTVKSNGNYTVGANKRQFERGSINCFNLSIPMHSSGDMKPDHNAPIPGKEKPRWNGND